MSPHPVDVHVGKRLRLRRTILGMSQEALGKIIGVTFQQIQKYERGVNRMGSSRLFEFAKAISVPVSYFFEGYEEQGKVLGMAEGGAPDFEHERMSSRETLELVRAYYKLTDPQVRKRVFELVKSIAENQSIVGAA